MRGSLANTADAATVAEAGLVASKAITGTSIVTAPVGHYFFKIVPSSAMAITTQGNVTDAINADLSTILSHPVGVPIKGKFTSITPASGDGIGYCVKG